MRTAPPTPIDELHAAVAAFARAYPGLSAAPPRPGEWRPEQVLAHLVYWHERYVRLLSAQLAGRSEEAPAATLKRQNADAVAALAGVPPARLLERLAAAQAALELIDADPRSRDLHIRLAKGAMARPWPVFAGRIPAHYRGHLEDLRRLAPARPGR